MTMPQPTVANTGTTDLRSSTLARLRMELENSLRSYEERLLQVPAPDDIAMAVHRRNQNACDEILAALSRVSRAPMESAKPAAVRYRRTDSRSCRTPGTASDARNEPERSPDGGDTDQSTMSVLPAPSIHA